MIDPTTAGADDDVSRHANDADTSMTAVSDADQQDGAEPVVHRVDATSVPPPDGSLVAIWRGLEVILRSILQSLQRIERTEHRPDTSADIAALRHAAERALEQSANRHHALADHVENRIVRFLARLDTDTQDTRAQFDRIERAARAIEGRLGMLATTVDRLERETGATHQTSGGNEGSSLPAIVRRVNDLELRLMQGAADQPSPQADLKSMLADLMDKQDSRSALSAAE
jgi:chromosome segregation ATPase